MRAANLFVQPGRVYDDNVLRRNYHQLVTGVYGSGHLLLRVHRVRHHRDNRRGGAQPAEKHSEGHRRFAAHRAVRVRDEQLHPNVDRYAIDTGWGRVGGLPQVTDVH